MMSIRLSTIWQKTWTAVTRCPYRLRHTLSYTHILTHTDIYSPTRILTHTTLTNAHMQTHSHTYKGIHFRSRWGWLITYFAFLPQRQYNKNYWSLHLDELDNFFFSETIFIKENAYIVQKYNSFTYFREC